MHPATTYTTKITTNTTKGKVNHLLNLQFSLISLHFTSPTSLHFTLFFNDFHLTVT
jgi:hypothetical protein